MEFDNRVRLIANLHIRFCSQTREQAVESPIPSGVKSIQLYDWGKPYTEIVGREFAVYGNGFPGDPVPGRLAAILSMEDAELLVLRLLENMTRAKELLSHSISMPPPKSILERDYNPDCYPLARVIVQPAVEIKSVGLEQIEYPYPRRSEGRNYNIMVTSLFRPGQRINALLLDIEEAERFVCAVEKVFKDFPCSRYAA